MSHSPDSLDSPDSPDSPQATVEAWPEENLELTADEFGGFYPVRLGEIFDGGRIIITNKLGWGGFSSVWLARDRKDDRHVALKVLSAYASREIEAGRLRERDILRKVTTASPLHHGFGHVIHLLHEFTFESFAGQHVCFATDVLGRSIQDCKAQLEDPRLPLPIILRITKHVLKGLEYLHDECKVIHSDLKPGNILLLPADIDQTVKDALSKYPGKLYQFPRTIPLKKLPAVPVISNPLSVTTPQLHWVIADLGHAHPQDEHLSDTVQPYALRAPEVILGLEWGSAIDIWSLGCMMYELATGNWLFGPKDVGDIPRNIVHLAQMTQRTGQHHDDAALKQYEIRQKHHDLKGMLERATVEGPQLLPIESRVDVSTVHNRGAEEVATFVRIMRSFLAFDPAQRPRAAEALLDPAFEDC